MLGMTAFGRNATNDGHFEVKTEITSVNKKYFDLSFRLSKEYQHEELRLRKIVSKSVARGTVHVNISVRCIDSNSFSMPINWAWVDRQVGALRDISSHIGVSGSLENSILELWQQKECFLEYTEEVHSKVGPLLTLSLEKALEKFTEVRRNEGQFLFQDIQNRFLALKNAHTDIAALSEGGVEKVRTRLQALLAEHVPNLPEDDRLLREIVLYADKGDVSEELSRILHHLNHFEKTISLEGACGKLLEFILQELLREFNTIGSKTPHKEVSTIVIVAKTEIEKIREQVQNVE